MSSPAISTAVNAINELPNATNKTSHLEGIVASLGSLTKSELQNVVDLVNIRHIVDAIAHEAELSLKVLERLCEAVEPKFLLEKFDSMFMMALASEEDKIIRVCLHQLQRVTEEAPHSFFDHVNILEKLLELLFSDNCGSLQTVESILRVIGMHRLEIFTCEKTLQLLEMMPAEKQLRFFDMIIKLCVSSENCLEHFLNSGIFRRLHNIYLKAKDVSVFHHLVLLNTSTCEFRMIL